MSRTLCLLFLSLLILTPPAFAGDSSSDTKDYLEMIDQLRDKPVDGQVEGWRRFLAQHPETHFRTEIENNLKNLEDLSSNTDPAQQKEKKDTERYLHAVEYSKKLSPSDQIEMWQQFLDENPNSIYRREAKKNLEELRAKQPGVAPSRTATPSPSSSTSPAPIHLTPQLEFKDPQKAFLLATFPGLVVPGIAHWYSEEYVFAGILTGLRLVGLGIGIPSIINQRTTLIWIGGILFGVSYMIDVVDAPFTVQRYNDALEKQKGVTSYLSPDRGPKYEFSYAFAF